MGAGHNLDQFNVQLGTGQGSSRAKSTQALSQDTALAMSWLGQTGRARLAKRADHLGVPVALLCGAQCAFTLCSIAVFQ
jgi:hypothetical protein